MIEYLCRANGIQVCDHKTDAKAWVECEKGDAWLERIVVATIWAKDTGLVVYPPRRKQVRR